MHRYDFSACAGARLGRSQASRSWLQNRAPCPRRLACSAVATSRPSPASPAAAAKTASLPTLSATFKSPIEVCCISSSSYARYYSTSSSPMASSTYSVHSAGLPTPRSPSPTSTASGRSSCTSSPRKLQESAVSFANATPSPTAQGLLEEAMQGSARTRSRNHAQQPLGDDLERRLTGTRTDETPALASLTLRDPLRNKGLAFTPDQRSAKQLTGLLPHAMESLEAQCARAMKMIKSRPTNIDKYLYLSSLKDQNADLFYRLLIDNIRELMPLIYTPTIGDVCLQYSTLYTRPEALYIPIKQRKSMRAMLRNWPRPNPEICVVTDGSRILGLGDLGINGVGISIGKLALYTAAAGIHPGKTLPIILDCGTDNEANLRDPFYLGLRHPRIRKDDQHLFIDEFMQAVRDVYPDMLVQFEDFDSEKAFLYLERYANTHRCFNDDIQGTGAVILAGYIGAINLSNVPIEEQRLVFMGAGSAGVGVAKQLAEYYTRRGLSETQARHKFWLVDTKGLVTSDRGDELAEHKKYFARDDNNGRQYRSLEEVIEYVKPTALIGLTATFGVFTEPVVRALKASVDATGPNRRPILFPLSNPLTKAECTFEQAVRWTDGTAIFASGSPFESLTLAAGASPAPVTFQPNQGNNVYVFPGLGLGAILAKAGRVTDDMVYTAAEALASSLDADEVKEGLIYPRIERVREASVVVAREVIKAARRGGVSDLPESVWAEWEEWGDAALTAFIQQRIYDPRGFSGLGPALMGNKRGAGKRENGPSR